MSVKMTKAAADQVRKSALEAKMDNTPLRVAATRNADNSIHYGLGFDDVGSGSEKDHCFESNGIELVVAESSLGLLDGTTIDFVELEPKQFHFVFLNPNDPNYSPPEQE
ncbi:MAG: iron-sulfur cluster assembly accessory protein [Gammaproteobacteria bacterium]|nr:iron-sulfur cluster assembly accessory protein [Gammaproteobacteria bacterium]